MEDNNKVGQCPHQIAIATSGNGLIYMLDFHPIANESKLDQLPTLQPSVHKCVEILATTSQIAVCAQKVVFLATSTGLSFVDMNGVF